MFRRLVRWGFDVAAALSLLVGLATVGLAVRGVWREDCASYIWAPAASQRMADDGVYVVMWVGGVGVAAADWQVYVGWWANWVGTGPPPADPMARLALLREACGVGWGWKTAPSRVRAHWSRERTAAALWGFGWHRCPAFVSPFRRGITLADGDYVAFPMWCPLALAAPLPVLWWARHRRTRRRREGSCAKCGYDLRASKERCPECGAVIGK